MRLSAAERAYLFELAGRLDPDAAPADQAEAPPHLADLVSAITAPAYALDQTWTALAWNAAAADLFRGWLDAGHDRNLLRYVFLSPLARTLIDDWDGRALRLAAEFRADFSRHLAAPASRALVDGLRRSSPFFDHAWQAHAVTEREGGERTFHHPVHGFLRYRQTTLLLVPHQDVKLVMLTSA
jgi:hypothetical protein